MCVVERSSSTPHYFTAKHPSNYFLVAACGPSSQSQTLNETLFTPAGAAEHTDTRERDVNSKSSVSTLRGERCQLYHIPRYIWLTYCTLYCSTKGISDGTTFTLQGPTVTLKLYNLMMILLYVIIWCIFHLFIFRSLGGQHNKAANATSENDCTFKST